jgi:DNA-binding response OmpR family regulator
MIVENRKANIILIEDSYLDATMIIDTLKTDGLVNQIIVYKDAETALKLIESEEVKPDLIFLDLNLSGMHGLEFLKIIKDSKPEITVVIVTNSSSEDDIIESYKRADYYIQKPISLVQLLLIIRSVESLGLSIVITK